MIVSDSGGGSFKLLEAGTHTAVCTQVVGIGPQETGYGPKEKVKLRFEVPAERVKWTNDDGVEQEGPSVIWATYTASLNEKANLRRDLEGWRGKAFTPEELKGFDLANLIGVGCMLSVVHNDSNNGKTYANIKSIAKLPKGLEAPKPEGDILHFDIRDHTPEQLSALPDWLRERVEEGIKNMSAPERDEPLSQDRAFEDDEVPF